MNINPQMISLLKSGNPQQMAMNMLKQNMGNNPILQNVMNMTNNNDTKGIENIARNLAKSRGINIDELYKQVTSMMR